MTRAPIILWGIAVGMAIYFGLTVPPCDTAPLHMRDECRAKYGEN